MFGFQRIDLGGFEFAHQALHTVLELGFALFAAAIGLGGGFAVAQNVEQGVFVFTAAQFFEDLGAGGFGGAAVAYGFGQSGQAGGVAGERQLVGQLDVRHPSRVQQQGADLFLRERGHLRLAEGFFRQLVAFLPTVALGRFLPQ